MSEPIDEQVQKSLEELIDFTVIDLMDGRGKNDIFEMLMTDFIKFAHHFAMVAAIHVLQETSRLVALEDEGDGNLRTEA